jgi:hypothetical protein
MKGQGNNRGYADDGASTPMTEMKDKSFGSSNVQDET